MMKDDGIHSALKELKQSIVEIHQGKYPKEIMKKLGEYGFYESFATDGEKGLFAAIESIAKVSFVCGNTGFCVWCQEALLWYLYNTNRAQSEIFKQLSTGETLGGTGLSNPIKSFAGLDKIALHATKKDDGYIINGTLPWVSNIDYGHFFAFIAKSENDFIMGLAECNHAKLKLVDNHKFIALDGSATKGVVFKEYFLDKDNILADPVSNVLPKILPGFALLQAGMAIGICECAIAEITRCKERAGNEFLPNIAELIERKEELTNRTKLYAKTPFDTSKEFFCRVLSLKFDFADLALELSKICMLSYGSKGYLRNSLANKLLLESYFIAIVTPSTKHIQKILAS